MNPFRIRKSSLIILGLLFIGILTGCNRPATVPPLNLYVDVINSVDDTVIVALENPSKSSLFVPAFWTGLVVLQELPSGAWVELKYPDNFQSIISTDDIITYSIPLDALDPGKYILVLQGRVGKDGVPFSLETNLDIDFPPESGQFHQELCLLYAA